jgi:hypothetical protein
MTRRRIPNEQHAAVLRPSLSLRIDRGLKAAYMGLSPEAKARLVAMLRDVVERELKETGQ